MKFRLFASFDLETTGLYPLCGDTAVEAASIIVKDGVPVDIFHRYYLPPGRLDPVVSEIHGLNRRTVRRLRKEQGADYPERWADDWQSLVSWWKSHEVKVLAAHNVSFDAGFFPAGSLDSFRLFCTMNELMGYCGIEKFFGDDERDGNWELKWPRLMEAFETLKINGDLRYIFPKEEMNNLKPHSALDDAKVVACLVGSLGTF
ncbi:MAG: 3'-5' exonuclease [Thermovirgaceae bacterium]|nr:3'-5' exonuclease [Thermovirgaceae bacterium]